VNAKKIDLTPSMGGNIVNSVGLTPKLQPWVVAVEEKVR
jgi:hypothetical protein